LAEKVFAALKEESKVFSSFSSFNWFSLINSSKALAFKVLAFKPLALKEFKAFKGFKTFKTSITFNLPKNFKSSSN